MTERKITSTTYANRHPRQDLNPPENVNLMGASAHEYDGIAQEEGLTSYYTHQQMHRVST